MAAVGCAENCHRQLKNNGDIINPNVLYLKRRRFYNHYCDGPKAASCAKGKRLDEDNLFSDQTPVCFFDQPLHVGSLSSWISLIECWQHSALAAGHDGGEGCYSDLMNPSAFKGHSSSRTQAGANEQRPGSLSSSWGAQNRKGVRIAEEGLSSRARNTVHPVLQESGSC
ncbi:hypothetical protein PAMP_021224 [Pampus punctatissimus]